MKHCQQLTYEQRCQIYVLRQEGYGQQATADAIAVSQPTISRELRRNTGERGYRHKQAQDKSSERRKQAVKPHKMTPANVVLIETGLRKEWSPDQVSGWLEVEHYIAISFETSTFMSGPTSIKVATFTCTFGTRSKAIARARAATLHAVRSRIA